VSEHPAFSAASLLRALLEGGVDFVVIGGLAAQAHGSPLITEDLDICFGLDRSNLERLSVVLDELAAIRRDMPPGVRAPLDARALRAGDVFTLRTMFGDLDLLARPDPGLDHDQLRSRATRFDFDGMTVWIADLEDVIAMKRAAGRPKDLLAIEHLGALREELDRRDD
jgi:predicted nucleotidyltransferase